MPNINTLLIDGSFEELAEELAQYLDERRENHDENDSIQATLAPLLAQNEKENVLSTLVDNSSILNTAPEKEFVAAYNLLIHLVRQAPQELRNRCLSRICRNLASPVTSSPSHGTGLALTVLTTVFNILPYEDDTRYNVFQAIISVVRKIGATAYESLKSQLQHVESWFDIWETDEDDQRKLYLAVSATANDAEDFSESYFYLLKALRTFDSEEADTVEARSLSVKALKTALSQPNHFDFQDVAVIDSVQALRKTDVILFELLEIFTSQGLEEYIDFRDEHSDWLQQQGFEDISLERKMKLLTLASLAAQAQTRSLPYEKIAQQLQVSIEDVEMWVIDVIRAGLVEGKLSQLNHTLLIHRSTYRVFGEKQWTEVQGRLDTWRLSLENVLTVIRQEREKALKEKERELKEINNRSNGVGVGRREIQKEVEVVGD